jgi:acetolactate synthase I/II/III large subunit
MSLKILRGLTGSKIIYNKLLENKVKDAFIYSGGSIMPIIDCFYNGPINYYVNTHEQSCGHAATGYAKSSGNTGVALVTSGPGITNLVTPLLDATNDSTPFIAISGQVNTNAIGTDAFQEAPAVDITKHVTKWSYCVTDICELPEVMDYAFYIANDRKKGSVHIDIPKNISLKKYECEPEDLMYRFPINNNKNDFIDKTLLSKIVRLIDSSKKPVLYVGQGCNQDHKLLTEFVEKSDIPVTTTIHANGVYDETKDKSLRWCGMHGSAAANYLLQESDLIIALGSRFDDRTTGEISKYAPNAMKAFKEGTGGIVHVNIEEKEINKVINTHYNFNNSCKTFLEEIIPKIDTIDRKKWIAHATSLKDKHPFKIKKSSETRLNMEHVLSEINNNILNKDFVITTGVGNHQMQTYQFILSKTPGKILSSGSLGVMGCGLPYAIGAKLANPEKLVLLIDGDSSFNMTLSELKTIKEYNIPVKIAIMNNSAQMMVTIWEKLFFNERYTATINNNNPCYTSISDGFGIKSISCNDKNYLTDTIKEFLEYPGPILCEFNIERDICLPLVAPGKALNEMILNEEFSNKMSGEAPS